jgi:heme-degrading monooxygenase HmoA
MKGLKKRHVLVDSAAHKNLTIALLESQADIDAVGPNSGYGSAFARTAFADGDATTETFHVEAWEGSAAGFARVVSYQIKRGQIEDRIRHWREQSGPGLRDVPGQAGRLVLFNRDSHKNLTVSFWNSEAELNAFERHETQQAALAQRRYAEGHVSTEHFEVVHEE